MLCIELAAAVLQAGTLTLGPLNLQLAAGEHLVLQGPSGAGKSVLLAAVMGWLPVRAGRLLLRGCDATRLPVQARGLGWVPQTPALFPHCTVQQNLAYGLHAQPRAQRRRTVAAWAERLDLQPLLGRTPGRLSGGEAQRVALARALAPAPEILLLDEPFSALDAARRTQGWQLLRALQQERGLTLLHVTHQVEEAQRWADRRVCLQGGHLRPAPTWARVSSLPQCP